LTKKETDSVVVFLEVEAHKVYLKVREDLFTFFEEVLPHLPRIFSFLSKKSI